MLTSKDAVIEKASQGDQEAFRRLWEDHHAVAMAAALRLCHQPGLAEDITQGAFLLAWRGLPRFRLGMPFTDPHIACPCLWAWKQFPPNSPYTVSFAAIEGSAYWRQGFEDLVIAQARWNLKRAPTLDERWHTAYSPLANFHKMPDGWVSSSSRAKGYRGGRVPFRTASHTPSIMPVGELDDQRDPIADLGWGGHEWTPWRQAGEVQVDERAQGLYRLRKSDENDLLFIGYGSIGDAVREARSAGRDLMVSYVVGPWCYHEQLELVTDALGLYLCQTGNLPHVQYGGEENKRAGSSWLLSSLTTQVICALFRLASAQSLRQPERAIA